MTPLGKSVVLAVALAAVCPAATLPTALTGQPFGRLPDGSEARLYTLKSADGFQADICDFGGRIVRLLVPDRTGRLEDVVLGFSEIGIYAKERPYFGALVGRVANRTSGAKFTLDGRTYALAANESPGGVPVHLHGGLRGFDKVMWSVEPTIADGRPGLRLRYTSADGEEGYPGTLRVEVLYSLTPDRRLRIDLTATTDQPTPVNLTSHPLFNLAGEGSGTVLDHVVTIRAQRYTPIDAAALPTGAILPVAGTPLDFTEPHRIGERIADAHEQIRLGGGYNHNYVLDPGDGSLALAATVHDSVSGRVLEVLTTEPGLQFFTANTLRGGSAGKSGRTYQPYGGFALEPQRYPDAVNQPAFPSIILRPGQTYRSTIIYRFSVR